MQGTHWNLNKPSKTELDQIKEWKHFRNWRIHAGRLYGCRAESLIQIVYAHLNRQFPVAAYRTINFSIKPNLQMIIIY